MAIHPVSVVTSISEGKQEADCKCLNWRTLSQEMLTILRIQPEANFSCTMKCKQEAQL